MFGNWYSRSIASGGSRIAGTPAFSVAAGTYLNTQAVSITSSTPGASIYYTTDGSAPTIASTLYSGAVSVSSSSTLKAIAIRSGYANSQVTSAAYVIGGNVVAEGDSITYGAAATSYADTWHATASASVTYNNPAVNGSEIAGAAPSLTDRAATVDALIQVGQLNVLTVLIGTNDFNVGHSLATVKSDYTTYVNARVAAGWIVVGQTMIAVDPAKFPDIEAVRGDFNTWLKTQEGVLLDYVVDYTGTSMDLGATAQDTTYYAADGVHPKLPGYAIMEPVYAAKIDSISGALVRTPVITLAAGSYTANQTTTITCATSGASIYYTIDGTTPTTASTLYTGAITIAASETLKAKAFKTGCVASSVASSAYVLTVATPTFSPAAGSFGPAQDVTISSTTPGASFYYTTDGSTPTTGSTLYTGAVNIASSCTLKALAVKTGCTNSAVGSAAYVIGVTYISATGGTVTTDGNYKVHTFGSTADFVITSGSGDVSYLIVGGGGGGGTVMAGGGGAGQVLSGTDTALGAGTYTATVGGGGAGSSTLSTPGTNGSASSWNSHSAAGGGAGGSFINGAGQTGASGGGGAYNAGAGGSATAGNAGGAASGSNSGGGGGGAGAVGTDGINGQAGAGGNGTANSITGSSVTYGGGGGGGGASGGGFTAAAGAGGSGGGGAGSNSSATATNGTANTGSGGGGGGYDSAYGTGGDGGSGVVIVRYQFQ